MEETKFKIEFDKPVQVSKEQYEKLRADQNLSGLLVFRQENGEYFFKTWYVQYAKYIEHILFS